MNDGSQIYSIFTPEDGDELSFDVDEIITNIEQVDPGWWIGTLDGSCGLFPSNYVVLKCRDCVCSTAQLDFKPSLLNLCAHPFSL